MFTIKRAAVTIPGQAVFGWRYTHTHTPKCELGHMVAKFNFLRHKIGTGIFPARIICAPFRVKGVHHHTVLLPPL